MVCNLSREAVRLQRLMLELRGSVDGECPICMESLRGRRLLHTPCGHAFHRGCLRQWLQRGHTCPMCRKPLRKACDDAALLTMLLDMLATELEFDWELTFLIHTYNGEASDSSNT